MAKVLLNMQPHHQPSWRTAQDDDDRCTAESTAVRRTSWAQRRWTVDTGRLFQSSPTLQRSGWRQTTSNHADAIPELGAGCRHTALTITVRHFGIKTHRFASTSWAKSTAWWACDFPEHPLMNEWMNECLYYDIWQTQMKLQCTMNHIFICAQHSHNVVVKNLATAML